MAGTASSRSRGAGPEATGHSIFAKRQKVGVYLGFLIAFTLTGLCTLKIWAAGSPQSFCFSWSHGKNNFSSHLLLQVQVLEYHQAVKHPSFMVAKPSEIAEWRLLTRGREQLSSNSCSGLLFGLAGPCADPDSKAISPRALCAQVQLPPSSLLPPKPSQHHQHLHWLPPQGLWYRWLCTSWSWTEGLPRAGKSTEGIYAVKLALALLLCSLGPAGRWQSCTGVAGGGRAHRQQSKPHRHRHQPQLSPSQPVPSSVPSKVPLCSLGPAAPVAGAAPAPVMLPQRGEGRWVKPAASRQGIILLATNKPAPGASKIQFQLPALLQPLI